MGIALGNVADIKTKDQSASEGRMKRKRSIWFHKPITENHIGEMIETTQLMKRLERIRKEKRSIAGFH